MRVSPSAGAGLREIGPQWAPFGLIPTRSTRWRMLPNPFRRERDLALLGMANRLFGRGSAVQTREATDAVGLVLTALERPIACRLLSQAILPTQHGDLY